VSSHVPAVKYHFNCAQQCTTTTTSCSKAPCSCPCCAAKQSKLLAELSAAGLTGREFDWGDLARLPYLNAVIKETLRLFAPATIASCRQADRDMTILGHHVPKVRTHLGYSGLVTCTPFHVLYMQLCVAQ
jgi:hypothetical protein